MREIKFRGKRIDNGEWIEGDLLRMNGHTFIFPDPAPKGIDKYKVDPETVGQYTGLKDRNGREIYEGDILAFVEMDDPKAFFVTVEWDERLCCIYLKHINCHGPDRHGFFPNCYTLEANIHDNPDLINPEE